MVRLVKSVWVARSLFLTICVVCIVGCSGSPEVRDDENPIQTVEGGAIFSHGKGFGSTRDQAMENALLDATRRASGVFLSDYLQIKDAQVLANETIQYSAGYVRQFEVLEETQESNGQYRVLLNAFISESALLGFYSDVRSDGSGAIQGSKLYYAISQEENRRESRLAILKRLFDGYPEQMFRVTLVGQNSRYTDERKVFVDIDWELRWSESFLKALYEHLVETSDEHCPMRRTSDWSTYSEDACGQFNFIGYPDPDKGFFERIASGYGESFRVDDQIYIKTMHSMFQSDHRDHQVGVFFSFENQNREQVMGACVHVDLRSYQDDSFLLISGYYNQLHFGDQVLSWRTEIEIADVSKLKETELINLSVIKNCS